MNMNYVIIELTERGERRMGAAERLETAHRLAETCIYPTKILDKDGNVVDKSILWDLAEGGV
jgi:hypothetical protein